MSRFRALLGPFIFILLWWIVGEAKHINPLYLSSRPDVLHASNALLSTNSLLDIWATFYRTVLGFCLATLLGIPLGMLLGSYKPLYEALEMVVDFFRSLPSPAILPLCLLIFGLGDSSKIALTTFVAFWIILINTIHGVWNVPVAHVHVGRVFKATKYQILKYITFYDALPTIFIGLRTALSLSLIIVIVAEMSIGSKNGLGQKILDSYNTYRIPHLYLFICLVGMMGFSLNKLFLFMETLLMPWRKTRWL